MNPLSSPVRSRIPRWMAVAAIAAAAVAGAVSAPIVAPLEAPSTDAAESSSGPATDLDQVAPAPAAASVPVVAPAPAAAPDAADVTAAEGAPSLAGVPEPIVEPEPTPEPVARPAAEIPMEVVGDRVNVRARPGLRYEIVGQVMRGDTVRVLERVDPWCRIDPPQGTTVWIHGEFVRNGEVLGDRVNVRAGPSLSYSVVGQVARGTRIREVSRYEAWVEIDPTPGASYWVNAEFLRPFAGRSETPPAGGIDEGQGTTVVETITPPDVSGVETVTIRGGTTEGAAEPAPGPATTTVGVRLIVPPADTDAGAAPADPPDASNVPDAAADAVADLAADAPGASDATAVPDAAAAADTVAAVPTAESLIPPALPETPATAIPLAEIEWLGPARDAVRTGEIHRTGFLIRRPGTHKLVQRTGRRVRLICYLRSDEVRLDEFVGRPVRITGSEQWAKGWPRPVIHVRQANLIP